MSKFLGIAFALCILSGEVFGQQPTNNLKVVKLDWHGSKKSIGREVPRNGWIKLTIKNTGDYIAGIVWNFYINDSDTGKPFDSMLFITEDFISENDTTTIIEQFDYPKFLPQIPDVRVEIVAVIYAGGKVWSKYCEPSQDINKTSLKITKLDWNYSKAWTGVKAKRPCWVRLSVKNSGQSIKAVIWDFILSDKDNDNLLIDARQFIAKKVISENSFSTLFEQFDFPHAMPKSPAPNANIVAIVYSSGTVWSRDCNSEKSLDDLPEARVENSQKTEGLPPNLFNPNSTNLNADGSAKSVDSRPIALNRPRPNYTYEARNNKVEGIVRLRALVGVDGSVKQVRVISGLPDGLNEEAVLAIKQMNFTPATKDGVSVSYWVVLEVEFNLR